MQAFIDSVQSFVTANAAWLEVLGIFAAGFGLASLLWLLVRKRAVRTAFEAGLQFSAGERQLELERHQQELETYLLKLRKEEQAHAVAQARNEALSNQLHQLQADFNLLTREFQTARSEQAAAAARLEEAQRGFQEREALFKETSAQLKQEFEHLANRVFDTQEERQQVKLQSVLTPFREQIVDFRKRVEEVYHTDTRERASLLAELKNLQQSSERINQEAENLTKALKGDKKLQGNWGELVLERVLEESGLRRNHEYVLQSAQRDQHGDLKRPDVLIRLPDNKDVVIDSKVSLNAYEEALAAEEDQKRERYLRQHLANLRAHVKKLSEQNYDTLPDVRSLDFVLLFIPIESAFTLAMEHDHRLFTEAFEQRIVIVSPTTLMMTLRIINNVWRYEKQNRNAQEIARRAGALYDKLRVLVNDMETLGKQLTTAEKTYSAVYAKLTSGKGNLVRQVEQFRELGAQVKKPMDSKLLDKSSDD